MGDEMKKVFMWFGIVCLALIVLAAGAFGILAYYMRDADATSKAYVREANAKILAAWSPEEMESRASQELKALAPHDAVVQLFGRLGQLGNLQTVSEPKGEANTVYNIGRGMVVTANYVSEAIFQNGTATIATGLIQHGKQWQLLSFHVNNVKITTPAATAAPTPASSENPIPSPAPAASD